MADQQIVVAGQATAPLSYTVPNSIEAALLCVNATIDGAGASGAFEATVEIVSDGGVVVARCPCFTTIAVGGTAEISWFRLRQSTSTSPSSSAYQTIVPSTAGIRSYWKLDETSGTTFSDSGPSAKTLNIVGAVALGASPLITAGHSAVFSGGAGGGGNAAQYAQSTAGYGLWPGDNSFTVCGWYRGQADGSTLPELLGMDDNNFRFLQFRISGTGKLELISFKTGGTTSADAVGATTINDGATHFLAGTWDGVTFTAKVYVDGALDGTAVGTGSYQTNTPKVTLAARLVGGLTENPVSGQLDEFALFSRALTAAEIAAFYAAGI